MINETELPFKLGQTTGWKVLLDKITNYMIYKHFLIKS